MGEGDGRSVPIERRLRHAARNIEILAGRIKVGGMPRAAQDLLGVAAALLTLAAGAGEGRPAGADSHEARREE
jgi:hypothetical protein